MEEENNDSTQTLARLQEHYKEMRCLEESNDAHTKNLTENKDVQDKEEKKFKFTKLIFLAIIKNQAVKTFGASSMHGLNNMIRTDSILVRIFYTILVMAGMAGAIYFCYSSSKSYFNYDVTTSIVAVSSLPVNFPAVTICNVNPFDSSNTATNPFLRDILIGNKITPNIRANGTYDAVFLVEQAENIVKANIFSLNPQNSTMVKSLGFSIDKMLISCYFQGQKCNSSDFVWYDFRFGNCYTFNKESGDSVLQTSQYGPDSGLSMEVFIGIPSSTDLFTTIRGLYVAINNNSQQLLTRYEGIALPPGFASNVGFARTFYSKQPSPYSDCVTSDSSFNSVYYKLSLQISAYSQKLCYELCLQFEFIVSSCSCTDPSIPTVYYPGNISVCANLSQLICVAKVRSEFGTSSLWQQCDPYCPIECERFEYSTSVSMAHYPSDYYYSVIQSQPNVQAKFNSTTMNQSVYHESTLLVRVFYSDLVYNSIQEDPALTFFDVVGIIGGQIGLFLGMSLLTFAEVIEYLIELMTTLFLFKPGRVEAKDDSTKKNVKKNKDNK